MDMAMGILQRIKVNTTRRARALFSSLVLNKGGYFSQYIRVAPVNNDYGSVEAYFTTSDGRNIPVYRNYRYCIKKGWKFYANLSLFHGLHIKGLLTESDELFLTETAGHRTLTRSLAEVDERLHDIIDQGLDGLFIPTHRRDGVLPVFKPEDTEIQSTIQSYQDYYRWLISTLERLDIFKACKGQRLLEIGYITGGYSLFAFERLGFDVSGVDNYFGGMDESSAPLPGYLKSKLNSRVNFEIADITSQTEFPEESFDIIFSASVLEHIDSIPQAMNEMYRLLKKGGIMVHGYNPFFCPNGGHGLGILDSPWGHVRINHDDYLRYVKEFRPYELPAVTDWITNALTRAYPIVEMQRAIINAGFTIQLWEEHPAPTKQVADLSPDILRDAMAVNPNISLADLVSRDILLVAKK